MLLEYQLKQANGAVRVPSMLVFSAVIGTVETTSQKTNFRVSIDIFVKIRCICPGWNQQYDGCAVLRFLICLADPLPDFTPIWRIAEYSAT